MLSTNETLLIDWWRDSYYCKQTVSDKHILENRKKTVCLIEESKTRKTASEKIENHITFSFVRLVFPSRIKVLVCFHNFFGKTCAIHGVFNKLTPEERQDWGVPFVLVITSYVGNSINCENFFCWMFHFDIMLGSTRRSFFFIVSHSAIFAILSQRSWWSLRVYQLSFK